jgi:hypothetical protein
MPIYLDVTNAAAETLAKIVAQRGGATMKGARYRVTVGTGGGSTASVGWDHADRTVTLNLPSLPSDAILTRVEADRIAGFIVHEACHVLHTDWAAWTTAVKAGPTVRHWANCLEDLRIEALEINRGAYPAMRTLLGRVTDSLLAKSLATGKPLGQEPSDAGYLATILGRVANGYPVPSAKGLDRAMTKPVAKLVKYALVKLASCRDTASVVKLARRLATMQAQAEQGEQGQGEGQSQGQSQGQGQGQGEGQSQGEQGQGQGEQGEQGEGEQGEGEGEQGEGEGQGQSQSQGQNQGQSQSQGEQGQSQGQSQGQQGHGNGRGATPAGELLSDLSDLTQAVAKANKADMGDGSARLTLHGWACIPLRHYEPFPDPERENVARTVLNARVPGRALLQQEMQRLLMSEEQRRVTHRETSGRLDRRALSRMRAGAVDVFARKATQPGRNTALGVLWDLSSSMEEDGRTPAAAATVYQLLQAADGSGASLGVYGFTSDISETGINGPCGGLKPIIPFGTRPKAPASIIAAIRPRGWTRLSPCVMGLARLMLDVPADRRVILAITDGDCDYGPDLVRQACEVARTWGVEVIGLGINAPSAIEAFPDGRSVNVADLAELAKTGMRVLADALELDAGAGD